MQISNSVLRSLPKPTPEKLVPSEHQNWRKKAREFKLLTDIHEKKGDYEAAMNCFKYAIICDRYAEFYEKYPSRDSLQLAV